MALTQSSVPGLDRLPEELLLKILCLAMDTTVPCVLERGECDKKYSNRLIYDDLQKAHHADWLAVNGTNQRFRRVGVEAFFASKTFIITAEKLARIFTRMTGLELPTDRMYQEYKSYVSSYNNDRPQVHIKDREISNNFNFYFHERDLEFVLRTIRHLYVVNVDIGWPAWWSELPARLKIFPHLRHLTGCDAAVCGPREIANMGGPAAMEMDSRGTKNTRLGSTRERMRNLLVENGMSENVAFHWAIVRLYNESRWMGHHSRTEFTFAAILDHFHRSSLCRPGYEPSAVKVDVWDYWTSGFTTKNIYQIQATYSEYLN
ncbi:hypothetical protein F5B21DRAFT_528921 [Xylaria acuta]|nr:hypothetical protein F5B21DRAFT_528921 [Xylaria acuta]